MVEIVRAQIEEEEELQTNTAHDPIDVHMRCMYFYC